MTMTEKLDVLMQERGLNKAELAREAGIPYMTIVNFYAKGTDNVKRSTLLKLAAYFDVTVDYLAVDEENRRQHPRMRPLATVIEGSADRVKPRIRPVVRGNLLDEYNVLGEDELPPNVRCDFTIQFAGNSMEKMGVKDGDIVFIRQQDSVNNHDVAAVLIDNKLTLRRIYRNGTQLVLMAENPSYAPMVVTTRSNVRIVGKAVAFIDPEIYKAP